MEDASRIYDDYLEAVLRGEAASPTEFLQGRSASEELRNALEALHRAAAGSADTTLPGPGGERPAAAATASPLERLGGYRIVRKLGQGGMGTVYLAEEAALGRPVALKVIRPEHMGSETAAARFAREARAIAKLRHPNVVTVYGAGETDGIRYLAMELVPGRALSDLLAEARRTGARVPIPDLVRWAAKLARALQAAHDEGVLHRDVKPSNVRITPEGEPILLDFGLARDAGGADPTITGSFLGTPAYVSPEQLTVRSRDVDGRTDVYSLGVTLYEGIVGRTPFLADDLGGMIRRILTEEPPSPRSIDATIGRDLDTVLRKAIEKDPDRRYATAAAFAEDLEALLAMRPIAARPPGPLRRLAGSIRRHPAATAALATAGLALLAGAAVARAQMVSARRDREAEARSTVEEARTRLETYRQRRRAWRDLESEYDRLHEAMANRYLAPDEYDRLTESEDAVAGLRREREAAFNEIVDLLRHAQRLDPAVEGIDDVRGGLYLEKWREATEARDPAAASFYREMIESVAPGSSIAGEVRGLTPVSISSDPPGAEVHLFRYVEQADVVEGGEHRLVPIPARSEAEGPVRPGTWCLRVVRSRGDLRDGDHVVRLAGREIEGTLLFTEANPPIERLDRLVSVDGVPTGDVATVRLVLGGGWPGTTPPPDGSHRLEIERNGERLEVRSSELATPRLPVAGPAAIAATGGVPATIHRDGALFETTLPAGLEVRPTAAPLLASAASRIGTTPIEDLSLEPGGYLALLRAEDRETTRFTFRVAAGSGRVEETVRLPAAGSTPPGFVFVPSPRGRDFRIAEYEVRCAEYLEFLNDPATLRTIAAAGRPIRYPRNPTRPTGHWPRLADGRWAIGNGFDPAWPVVGIGWDDAAAYAAWRTERARTDGRRWTFRLPHSGEWHRASGDFDGRRYVFGDRFRAVWCNSCYSRPRAEIEPVGSYTIDESIYGCYDLAGSVFEWLDWWWVEERGLRTFAGGSWGHTEFDTYFLITGANGQPVEAGVDTTGFRLVLDVEDEDR